MEKLPRERIREIYDARREFKEKGMTDEIDTLFGKASTLEKAIIMFLDQEFIDKIKNQ